MTKKIIGTFTAWFGGGPRPPTSKKADSKSASPKHGEVDSLDETLNPQSSSTRGSRILNNQVMGRGERGVYGHSEESSKYQVLPGSSEDEALSKMTSYAKQWKGTPYGWGGEGKGMWSLAIPDENDKQKWRSGIAKKQSAKDVDPELGIDCSGFMKKVLSIGGVSIGRDMTAEEMYHHLRSGSNGQEIKSPAPGAMAFFEKGGKITHIGMIGKDGETVIESRGGKGYDDERKVSSSGFSGYKKKYVMPNYFWKKKAGNQFMASSN